MKLLHVHESHAITCRSTWVPCLPASSLFNCTWSCLGTFGHMHVSIDGHHLVDYFFRLAATSGAFDNVSWSLFYWFAVNTYQKIVTHSSLGANSFHRSVVLMPCEHQRRLGHTDTLIFNSTFWSLIAAPSEPSHQQPASGKMSVTYSNSWTMTDGGARSRGASGLRCAFGVKGCGFDPANRRLFTPSGPL